MLTYEPHKGEFYLKAIGQDSYLFVSAGHHCLSSRRKSYGCEKEDQNPSECLMKQLLEPDFCPAFNTPCPLFESCKHEDKTDCDKRKKLLCETKLCIHDHITNRTEPNIVFSNFYAFRKKLIEEKILISEEGEDEYSLWSKVCFQNYVQTITTHKENNQFEIEKKYLKQMDWKEVRGLKVKCDINEEAFKNNCENIRPDVIVVLYYVSITNCISIDYVLNGRKVIT